MKHSFLRHLALFLVGAAGYGLLEMLWRGHTHISMLLLGGFCFVMLWRLAAQNRPLLRGCISGSLLITAGELLVGCVVNLWLDLGVWDYTEEPVQLMGQVCIRFTLLWAVLCALLLPAIQWTQRVLAAFREPRVEEPLQWRYKVLPLKQKKAS